LSEVSVTVETDSVFTDHRRRDRHLTGRDFLQSGRYEVMTFTADSGRRTGEDMFEVVGSLELLGVTRPLTLTATLNQSGEHPIEDGEYVMGVSARGSLDRSDYGMDYAVDNGWVGDTVEILIEFEARRQ
jgi:polyisoprenoid-binding protein YceI